MAHAHRENLKQAMDTLRAHKMRSALTVFGVVLGVSVIMLVAALITGFDETIQENIKQFGADTAFVSRWDQGPHGGGNSNERPLEERLRKPLTLEDAEALKEGCPAIKNVTVFLTWWERPHTIRTKAGQVSAIDFRGVQPNLARSTPMPPRWPADSSAKATISTAKRWSCWARTSHPSSSRKGRP